MKVILIKDVAKVGKKHETKEVSSGHALNYLIPRGEAVAATPDALKRTEVARAKMESERKVLEDLLAKNINDLDGITLSVSGKANDKGHLFAGLHREAIVAELLKQTGLQVSPEMIQIEHPVKEVGEHMIKVAAEGKSATFKLVIQAL